MGWHLAVVAGQHSTVITAGAGERWRLVATYSRVTDTEWGVNADGLTYGVANDRGTPDLVAAIASNGKVGYVYSRDLIEPAPTSLQIGAPTGQVRSIPVYTSDGHTVIGQLGTGSARAARPRDRGATGPVARSSRRPRLVAGRSQVEPAVADCPGHKLRSRCDLEASIQT